MNAAILLLTSAWLAGADCGTPACGASCDNCNSCDTCCEVKEKKSFFKKKKKCDTCETCDTCTTYVAPATCGCEDDCGCKKESFFSRLFKRKKKCDECDTCNTCDSCDNGGGYAPSGTIIAPQKTGPESVPLPSDPKDKTKTQAPQAPGNNITPTSTPKPLELGSSPY